jgi:hypothetical protein
MRTLWEVLNEKHKEVVEKGIGGTIISMVLYHSTILLRLKFG